MDESLIPESSVVPPAEAPVTPPRNNKKYFFLFVAAVCIFLVIAVAVFSFLKTQSSGKKTEQPATMQVSKSPTQNTVIDTPKGEKIVSVSPSFTSTWSAKSAQFVVSESGKRIVNTPLSERPLAAWLDVSSNYLVVITTAKDTVDAPHNLYVIKNNVLHRVLEGKAVKMGGKFTSNDHLYDYWDFSKEDEVTRRMERTISISPDDSYLFIEWLQYESLSPTAINLKDLSVQEDTEIRLASLSWSPTGKCSISNGGGYGVTTIVAGALVNNKFLMREFEGKALENPQILDTWWDDACSGIIKAEVYNGEGKTSQVYYSFNYATDSFKVLSSVPDLTNLQQSAVPDQKLLFYTVQKTNY